MVSLRIYKDQFSDQKYIRRAMESKLESMVNYLQFFECTLGAAKQNEELQNRPSQQQEEAYENLPIY